MVALENSICSTKNWVSIGVFANATPAGKICQRTEKMEDADKRETEQVGEDPGNEVEMPKCIGGAGRFFQYRPPKNKNQQHVKESTACLFKEFDALLCFSGKRAKT